MISIVVVNYNGGRGVVENLRALRERLPGGEAEIVVVDNASSDGSADAIAGELPWVRLVRSGENRGYAAGVNAGLAAAGGSILVIMNPDIVPEPGALELLCSLVRERGERALFGGAVIDTDGRLSGSCFRALPRPADILREGVLFRQRQAPSRAEILATTEAVVPTEVVSGSVLALRQETLEALGPMDEDLFLYREDVEWCHRALELGMEVALVPGAQFRHEGGASTRSAEGVAFAARVLSDFHYFHNVLGLRAEKVKRLWMAALWFRATLYQLDASLGLLGRREESERRAAIYRLLRRRLRRFDWGPVDGQNAHPSRLGELPCARPRPAGDDRPRILFVLPDADYGGAQRRVDYLVRGPLSRRFDFEVLCLREAGRIGERLRGDVPLWEARVDGWARLSTWREVRDLCKLLEPDLVHSSTLPADIGAWVGFRGRARWLSVKVSVDTRLSWPVRLVEWLLLRSADTVYAVSDEVAAAKSYLGRTGMLPLVVSNPPMIDFADEEPRGLAPDKPVVVAYVGRLERVKRVGDFLDMAALLARAAPGRFSFKVVGDGSMMSALIRKAAELGIGDIVEFRGATADVASELDALDIVVLFSAGEGSPNTVLETIARGRIPLARRAAGTVGSVPSVLERCLVDSESPAAFAERVQEILDGPDEFLAKVRVAREALRRRRAVFESAMGRLYETVLRRRRGDGRVRVLHLITRLIVGGAQENTIASVEQVDPSRYDSHLWCGPQTGLEGSLFQDARERGESPRVLPNLVREISPLRDLAVTLELTRLLRRERFDIVHTHCSKAGIVGRIAARIAGVPHIIHTHHGLSFHDRMNPALRRFFITLERMMAAWTHPMISVSERTTSVGLSAGVGRPEDYRLIRSGIPLTTFGPDAGRRAAVRRELGIAEGEVAVGSVGRLTPQKNPLDFVELASAVLASHRNATFLYVGDGPLMDAVAEVIEERGLAERVRLLGLRTDVPDLLRAMDIFVLTSLWEGLPRVVLQALATGLPVVAYDTAGILEAVEDGRNGHLVATGDVARMVEHVVRLVSDAELRGRMGEAARELDRGFSEDGMIRDLEALYEEMTSSGAAGGERAPGLRGAGREGESVASS